MEDPGSRQETQSIRHLLLRAYLMTFVLALGYGLFTRWVFGSNFGSQILSTFSYGFLCLTPFAIGAITAFLLRNNISHRGQASGGALVTSLMISSLFLVGVVLLNIEVWICIIMAAPLFLLAALLGTGVMGLILRYARKHRHLRNSPQSLLVVLLLAPYLVSPTEMHRAPAADIREVNNSIDIAASPEVVWANIVSVPDITADERQLRLSHIVGIPQPLEATVDFEGLGGMRHALYDNGLAFEEVITIWEPHRMLRFSIQALNIEALPPPFNEWGGPFEAFEGTYRLEVLDAGGVRLQLSSLHRLNTRINAYGGLWTNYLMWDLQQYILEIVKARSESA
jgi:hypothetical protein